MAVQAQGQGDAMAKPKHSAVGWVEVGAWLGERFARRKPQRALECGEADPACAKHDASCADGKSGRVGVGVVMGAPPAIVTMGRHGGHL